jgi:NAD(P)H dehydrogenase (quinone)
LGDHFKTEDHIKSSGLGYTLLRNTLYSDGFPLFAGEKVFEHGINLPAGDGKVPYASINDLGEAAAQVIANPQNHHNQTYELVGNDFVSFGDLAAILTKLSGKNVAYNNVDSESFPATLKQFGVPDPFIFIVVGFVTDIRNHLFEVKSGSL